MTIHQKLATCVILASLLILGCEFESPLVDPATCELDTNLFGTWHADDHKFYLKEYYVIGKPYEFKVPEGSPKGLMSAVEIFISEGFSFDSQKCHVVTFAIAGENYVMLIDEELLDKKKHQKFDFSKQKRFYIAKYRVTGDKLELWKTMDLQNVEAAIANGSLKGRSTEKNNNQGYPTLTESADNMRRYLANGGSKNFFTDRKTYTRER